MTKQQLKDDYERETKRVVEIIIQKYKPEKIVAFGSTATGNVNPDSDIDLLVIKKTVKKFWERVKEVLLLVKTRRSFDVSVFTPQEIQQAYRKDYYFITEEMLEKGKTLYERKA